MTINSPVSCYYWPIAVIGLSRFSLTTFINYCETIEIKPLATLTYNVLFFTCVSRTLNTKTLARQDNCYRKTSRQTNYWANCRTRLFFRNYMGENMASDETLASTHERNLVHMIQYETIFYTAFSKFPLK